MRKALVLGIGNAQVDLIKALKEAGWYVIGCSYRCEGRGLDLIDQFELINITDFEGIRDLAQKEKVKLIYSIGSDLAMPTVAKVASGLGLPTLVSPEIALLLQNKLNLRGFLAEHSLSSISYARIRDENDIDQWATYPAIVKPVDSQGQRGVFLALNKDDVIGQMGDSLEYSSSRTLIIEEYLDGSEVSVNVFVIDGRIAFIAISDRLVVKGYAFGIPKAHVFPSNVCSREDTSAIYCVVQKCIDAIGVIQGPIYFQIKIASNGPQVIEITPRLDGCHLWRIIKMATGVDLLQASIDLLGCGGAFQLSANPTFMRYRLIFFLCPPGREFRSENFSIDVHREKEEYYYEFYYKDGDIIRPINGKLEKVGYYIERMPGP